MAPDGLNVYVTDDCLYAVKNYRRDLSTGNLEFDDELRGSSVNGDGLGCLKGLSFTWDGVSRIERQQSGEEVRQSECGICTRKRSFYNLAHTRSSCGSKVPGMHVFVTQE